MFNLQGSEIIFILLLALVVLGPEKLPSAIRKFTQTYAELRKMGTGFQTELKSALDEPMREMKETAGLLRDAADPAKTMADAERDAERKLRAQQTGAQRAATDKAVGAVDQYADPVSSDAPADIGADTESVDEWADPVEPDEATSPRESSTVEPLTTDPSFGDSEEATEDVALATEVAEAGVAEADVAPATEAAEVAPATEAADLDVDVDDDDARDVAS